MNSQLAASPGQSHLYQDSQTPRKVRVYLPGNLSTIRGILFIGNGAGGDASFDADKAHFQSWVDQHGFAIAATGFFGNFADGAGGDDWRVLWEGLQSAAAISGHPELLHAPFINWGFSNGGQMAYGLARLQPHKTIAFIVNKGAFYQTANVPSADAPPTLAPVSPAGGWLVDQEHAAWSTGFPGIRPAPGFAGDPLLKGWVPSETAARLYRASASYDPSVSIFFGGGYQKTAQVTLPYPAADGGTLLPGSAVYHPGQPVPYELQFPSTHTNWTAVRVYDGSTYGVWGRSASLTVDIPLREVLNSPTEFMGSLSSGTGVDLVWTRTSIQESGFEVQRRSRSLADAVLLNDPAPENSVWTWTPGLEGRFEIAARSTRTPNGETRAPYTLPDDSTVSVNQSNHGPAALEWEFQDATAGASLPQVLQTGARIRILPAPPAEADPAEWVSLGTQDLTTASTIQLGTLGTRAPVVANALRLTPVTLWQTVATLPAGAESWSDSSLSTDTTCEYRVRALGAETSGDWSDILGVQVPPAAPRAALHNTADGLRLHFNRASTDLDYIVESTRDLTANDWRELTRNPGTPGETVSVPIPTDSHTRLFLRVRVE